MQGQCRRGADIQSLWPILLAQKLHDPLEIVQRVVGSLEKRNSMLSLVIILMYRVAEGI